MFKKTSKRLLIWNGRSSIKGIYEKKKKILRLSVGKQISIIFNQFFYRLFLIKTHRLTVSCI